MKRFFLSVIVILLLFNVIPGAAFIPTASAQEDPGVISVFLDGLPVAFDVPPVIREDRTLVPFRAIAEALNIQITWDGSTQTVYAHNEKISVRLQIGNTTAYLNQNPFSLDAAPVIISDRSFIPLRFFTEAFGCEVKWDGTARSVRISSPRKKMTIKGFYALGDSETSSWKNLFGKNFPETDKGNTGRLGELALGWYSLDRNGTLLTVSRTGWQRPEGWERVLEAAKKYNLKTEMVVHLTDGDGTVTGLLADRASMEKAVKAICQEAKLYGSVNLDFEGLGWNERGEALQKTRTRFTDFVRLLSEKLKENRVKLVLSLHPLNSAYPGYDYKSLGELADQIVIMAYDYGIRPEPANLVIQAVEMAKEAVGAEKLILGISIPNETPESLLVKAGIAKRHNLGGIAIWRLGLLTDEMWMALEKSVSP